MATYFTLLKGFICTGIIYLPKSVYNGGWGFSAFALILSFALTLTCFFKLLECRAITGKTAYTDIGQYAYQKTGKVLVDIALVVSQVGFVCAYVWFISS